MKETDFSVLNVLDSLHYRPALYYDFKLMKMYSGESSSFFLYWGGGWGPRISRAHSLLVNLKHRAEMWRGKRKRPNSPNQLLKSAKMSKTKEPAMGRWPGSLSSLVAGSMFL